MNRRLGAGLVVAAVLLTLGGTAGAATPSGVVPDTSSVWAGYEALSTSPTFTGVSTSFTVPTGICRTKQTSFVSIWAGFGGENPSDRLLQAGVTVQCFQGTASYFPWWQYFPVMKQHKKIGYPVAAGDVVTVSVTTLNDGDYLLGIGARATPAHDPWNWALQHAPDSPQTKMSAECVAERPLAHGTPTYLAQFTTVTFNGCSATTPDASYTLNRAGTQVPGADIKELTMTNSAGATLAQPTGPTKASPYPFYVKWKAAG